METDLSEVLYLTRELVRIPSENPTGTELKVGEYVFNWLKKQGVEVRKEAVEEGRFNVIARISGGNRYTPSLVWLAHLDTVPAGDGWRMDPFGGDIIEGRLYGRGSADMKGGLAAAMVALRDLVQRGEKPNGNLILLATIDEEGEKMKGAMAAFKNGWVNKDSYLVAVEPSGLKVLPAHKGPNWYKIGATGKMAHAGMPKQGVDAIHAMCETLISLKRLVEQLSYDDELLGPTTINLGRIDGGLKTNIVPPYCEAEVDMRVTYPMTVEEADAIIANALANGLTQIPNAKLSWERLGLKRPPLKMPDASPLRGAFLKAVKRVVGKVEIAGFPAYTDAAILASLTGTPHCLTFGPGYLEQAHAADEFVPTEHLQLAVEVLKEVAISLLW